MSLLTSYFVAAAGPSGDANFSEVVLLLDFAGSDAATDITDLSLSSHVDTFNGNAQVDTAITALGENTVLLDGTGDSISFPNSPEFDFGTEDFTLELTYQSATDARTGGLLSTYDTPNGWTIQHLSGTGLRFLNGDTLIKSEDWDPTEDQMYHIAICRSGTSLRTFVDGTQLGTATTDSTDLTSTAALIVGGLLASTQNAHGSIGAVRITKGFARYTANFTAPSTFYPTEGAAATDDDFASVELLLDMAGADTSTTFTDLSNNAHTTDVVGNGQVDTAQQKFGTGSFLTDGTDDSIHLDLTTDFADFDLGSANFTIEMHIRANTSAGADQVFEMGPVNNYHIAMLMSNNNMFMEYSEAGGVYTQVDSGHNAVDATWHHMALVRNGNDLDLYMDGVKGATTADLTGITLHALDSSAELWIGNADGSGSGYDGWIDNVRWTPGVARYTANFQPPFRAYPTA